MRTIESDLRILLSFGKVGCRSKIRIILQCVFRISTSVAKTCFLHLVFTALLFYYNRVVNFSFYNSLTVCVTCYSYIYIGRKIDKLRF